MWCYLYYLRFPKQCVHLGAFLLIYYVNPIPRALPAFPVSQTCREGLYSWWSLLTSSASPEWTMCASEGLQSRPLRFRYKIQKALSFIWFWNTGIWNPLTLDTFALKLLISLWEWEVLLRLSSTSGKSRWGSFASIGLWSLKFKGFLH